MKGALTLTTPEQWSRVSVTQPSHFEGRDPSADCVSPRGNPRPVPTLGTRRLGTPLWTPVGAEGPTSVAKASGRTHGQRRREGVTDEGTPGRKARESPRARMGTPGPDGRALVILSQSRDQSGDTHGPSSGPSAAAMKDTRVVGEGHKTLSPPRTGLGSNRRPREGPGGPVLDAGTTEMRSVPDSHVSSQGFVVSATSVGTEGLSLTTGVCLGHDTVHTLSVGEDIRGVGELLQLQ